MQINSIKISNILSFEHKDNIEDCEEIRIDKNLNILIGPNGSGKSNFLEILNQIFKNILFKQANFNEEQIDNHKKNTQNPLNATLTEQNIQYKNLSKNESSSEEAKRIKLVIGINKNDIENLEFVYKNAKKFNEIFKKYCNIEDINFGVDFDVDEFEKNKEIIFFFEDLDNQGRFIQVNDSNNQASACLIFIKHYFEHFDFIQKAIIIANKHEYKENWLPLKNTFALIGCYRNYNQIESIFSVISEENQKENEIRNKDLNDDTKISKNEEPVAFTYVRKKISYKYNELIDYYSRAIADKKIKQDPLFKNINDLLDKFLKIKLKIARPNPNSPEKYELTFIDENHKSVNTSGLSAGEKGIIHFIFSIYGYDVEKGLMIIDEPELHLHPQTQGKYLDIINEAIDKLDLQFIIATHSPVFVNPTTINSIYRFSLINGITKVVHPTITEHEKDLTRILNYTNSAKIFFSSKVILVEGDSDEYFYRRFLDNYKKIKKENYDIEFLYIQGKGSRRLWTNFLKNFKVKTYFIGDWDNIVNVGILDQSKLYQLIKKIKEVERQISKNIQKKVLNSKGSTDGIALLKSISEYINNQTQPNLKELSKIRDYMITRHLPYNRLVEYLKLKNPEEFKKIIGKINNKHKKHIYILKYGELENYLGLEEKGLNAIIQFTKGKFKIWEADPFYKKYIRELNSIFGHIIKN